MSDYVTPAQKLLEKYKVTEQQGLNNETVLQRIEEYGENKLTGTKHKNFFQKFLEQMKDYMVLILIAAAVISFVIAIMESGEFIDSIVILAIVILNGILGVQQESKAEKALDALQDMSAPTARVMRLGRVEVIPSAQLVPGDIVLLEAGDFIPADGRILQAASLKCEESALTGESLPVEKDANAQVVDNAPLGDRINMVYSGCSVTYGRATVLITSTGMNTEMGKIAGLLNKESTELTPLQIRLNQLGKYLGILAIVICAVIFFVGLLQGMPAIDIFMTAVSLAVAAIPEGLTAVVTVVLALGVQKMVKHNAIVRRLPAVETLGSASVICSDKTGTLTQNRMTVQQVWPVGKQSEAMSTQLSPEATQIIRLGTLCNDGRLETNDDGTLRHVGDPTETAIVAAAHENNIKKSELDQSYNRVAEIPFDSDRKLMTTVHKVNGRLLVVVKGGFDVLLPLCNDADIKAAERENLAMAEKALRVLAVAFKELPSLPGEITPAELENNLTFAGLIGMIDPPREESKQAVGLCAKAGIRTVMITGDHVVTAGAIAKELGILSEGDRAISGQELQQLSDEDLVKQVDEFSVYARVSPEDKIRIVQAWQSRGAVVAMTGDGVNDAPALKAADIGCAMGITGTDVAKGAADMVLTDDNFSTIVSAVKHGRGIYDNITRTIQFLLGSNLGEVFTVFFAMIFWKETPLLAIHLLLVNVITDALPALALGMEPTHDSVMHRKPIPKNQGIFANNLGIIILLQGCMVGILTLTAFFLGSRVTLSPIFAPSTETGMTMAFLVLALSQLVQAFNCRGRESLFKIGVFTNSSMNKAFLASLVVIILICFVPPLEELFHIVTVSVAHWLCIIGLSIAPLIIMEIVKLVISAVKKK